MSNSPTHELKPPTDEIDQSHYNTGWNDTAHGILTWTNGSETYPTVEAWATSMRRIANECKPHARGSHNVAYYDGVIACVDHYMIHKTIYRRDSV